MQHPPALRITVALLLLLSSARAFAQDSSHDPSKGAQRTSDPIPLWPGTAPGEAGDIGEEKDTTKPGQDGPKEKYIIRLGNVTKPTITVFRPPADKDTGAAVVVCPGGGYSILAMDLEGTEVCQWLNSVGVTGVLLKYRVPARKGMEKHAAALQDAQRALGMVRQRAKEWNVDPKRVGVLGFSAGGHLAAAVSNNYAERTYPAVDDADKQSCRPDFTVLIYPAYLVAKDETTKLSPEIKVTPETPPAFIVMTEDDPVRVARVPHRRPRLRPPPLAPPRLHRLAPPRGGVDERAGLPEARLTGLAEDDAPRLRACAVRVNRFSAIAMCLAEHCTQPPPPQTAAQLVRSASLFFSSSCDASVVGLASIRGPMRPSPGGGSNHIGGKSETLRAGFGLCPCHDARGRLRGAECDQHRAGPYGEAGSDPCGRAVRRLRL